MAKSLPPLPTYPRESLSDIDGRRVFLANDFGPLNQMALAKTGKGGRVFTSKKPTSSQIVNAGRR
jgi:hypothetical protein